MARHDVVALQHLGNYRLRLRFSDGLEGEIDLEGELSGGAFQALRDPQTFAAAHIELGTIAWTNGADFAPTFLRERLHAGLDSSAGVHASRG
jgi:hypothetical protein